MLELKRARPYRYRKSSMRFNIYSRNLDPDRDYTVIVTDVPLTVHDVNRIVNVLLRVQKMCFDSRDIECAETVNALIQVFMPVQKRTGVVEFSLIVLRSMGLL